MTILDLVKQIENNFKEINFSIIENNKVLFFTQQGLLHSELRFSNEEASFFEAKNKLTVPLSKKVTYFPKSA